MRTIESVKAKLRARLGNDQPMPIFTAIETLICEEIDRLAKIPVKHDVIKPHEISVFEDKIKQS